MKRMTPLIAVIASLGAACVAQGGPITVTNKCSTPAITVVNKTTPEKTLCGCAFTGDCDCWDTLCGCSACGRSVKGGQGGAVQEAKKSLMDFRTTQTTHAPDADTPLPPGQGPGSSAGTQLRGPTYTLAPAQTAGSSGNTSPCATGNCPGTATSNRGWFRSRR